MFDKHLETVAVLSLLAVCLPTKFTAGFSSESVPKRSVAPSNRGGLPTPRVGEPTRQQLALLTFDLDDTLFPIGPVVDEANAAMLKKMTDLGTKDASFDRFMTGMKAIRATYRERGEPVKYSDLRVEAIVRDMIAGGLDPRGAQELGDEVFQTWLAERQASAERNLFPLVTDSLDEVRRDHPGVVMGAVTNGRGSPLEMPSLLPYFDFSVSGEEEGVFPQRKPAKGIYEFALQRASSLPGVGVDMKTVLNKGQELHSTCWIHVGDDLANDCGASVACGARTIWLQHESLAHEEADAPSWSTASTEEQAERKKQAEDALSKVDARISCLSQIPEAIRQILATSVEECQ